MGFQERISILDFSMLPVVATRAGCAASGGCGNIPTCMHIRRDPPEQYFVKLVDEIVVDKYLAVLLKTDQRYIRPLSSGTHQTHIAFVPNSGPRGSSLMSLR